VGTPQGAIEEVYNGPGAAAWNAAGRMQRNGHRVIRVGKLRYLTRTVDEKDRIAPPSVEASIRHL
jgi:hypothetical protein